MPKYLPRKLGNGAGDVLVDNRGGLAGGGDSSVSDGEESARLGLIIEIKESITTCMGCALSLLTSPDCPVALE